MPIFWSKEYENQVTDYAYKSGFEEGKHQGELEGRTILHEFIVKAQQCVPPGQELPFPYTISELRSKAESICLALVSKIGSITIDYSDYQSRFNPSNMNGLQKEINDLRKELDAAHDALKASRGQIDDTKFTLAETMKQREQAIVYARGLEANIDNLSSIIKDLQDQIDRAKNAGK